MFAGMTNDFLVLRFQILLYFEKYNVCGHK